ncbi:MAG: RNA 3'-terminal phosphate cyclase [Gammaproteobacteria bacterium]|jgi:RNA 3'-terminal phosphate cyclase (ATP)
MNEQRHVYIDGSQGEGGGQVLRSSLAISVCLKKPFRMENIRARRKKPGLLRRHLTAVRAAARISNARVEGDHLGSQQLVFEPNDVQPGEYHFSIGTAGSTTLVLQTIMLPLLFADGPSKIAIEGGTHNPMAPPFEFIQQAYLPILDKMGGDIEIALIRPGFFPKGGGCLELHVQPTGKLKAISLKQRGKIQSIHGAVYIVGLPKHIAEREINVLARQLNVSINHFDIISYGTELGPGNVVSVAVESENISEVFTGYGQKGVKAEIVAKKVANEVRRYIDSGVAVDEHLADQLLLPMGLAGGGEFVTCQLTQHTETNIRTVKQFLDINYRLSELNENCFSIKVAS